MRPGGRAATLTLAEFVEEYLQAHPGLPVTVSKLRWLLGKATAVLGEVRLIDLTPEQVSGVVEEAEQFEVVVAGQLAELLGLVAAGGGSGGGDVRCSG
jgi:hypothetical protein